MKIPQYVVVLVGLLIVSLMCLSLVYIWFPDFVGADTFFRILISFGVLLVGAIVLALLGRLMGGANADK